MASEARTIHLDRACDLRRFMGERDSRFSIRAAHVDPKSRRVLATNGHLVASVPILDSDGSPVPIRGKAPTKPVLVDGDVLADVLRAASDERNKEIAAGFGLAALTVADGNVVLTANDMGRPRASETKPVDAAFPDVGDFGERYDGRRVKATVALGAGLLREIAAYFAENKGFTDALTLEIRGEEDAVRITGHVGGGREAEVWLMPMRMPPRAKVSP